MDVSFLGVPREKESEKADENDRLSGLRALHRHLAEGDL